MNILFLSGIIPKQLENYVIRNTTGNVEFAANKYQQLMIKGLKRTQSHLTVLNSMYVNSFPRGFKKPIVRAHADMVNETNANDAFINTGFLNIFGIRHFSKYIHVKSEMKKWLRNHGNNRDNCVVGYSVFGEALDAFRDVKKSNSNVQTCLVVPDLPNYCRGSSKLYNRYLSYIDKKLGNYQIFIDKYILFSKYMAEELKINENQYIVVEGICDDTFAEEEVQEISANKKTVLLYTGALEEKYGLITLLDAFEQLNKENIELHFCGSGTAEAQLQVKGAEDNRIVLHGKVSNAQATKLQKEADILVNPRTNEGIYTRFSFPSKTMEYLVSGTPMIGYKLDGIPDEYDQFITYINGPTVKDLADAINKMVAMGEESRADLGKRARAFIIEYKNPVAQMQRVEDFLKRG